MTTQKDVSDKQTHIDRLRERAEKVLVGGVNSPVRSFAAVGAKPIFIRSAKGAHVIDVDGNRYIDLVGSWGPAIVGHAHPLVVEAVQEAVVNGLSFGANCAAETELAELIISALPSVEQIRFVSSGTEATMSAIRLARAATSRSGILKFEGCYHGHVDSLLVAAGSGAASKPDSAGVPDTVAADTFLAPYNDIEAVRRLFAKHGHSIAAVVVEPVAGNMGLVKPADGFLEGLRTACTDAGALLIFDEVMTGFRVCWGGYQNLCGVEPDLTCLGKVIGGGLPVAAYGGARALMQLVSPAGPTYQAGTLSGNPVAMASGIATLRICQRSGFYERLDESAAKLSDGLAVAGKEAGVDAQSSHVGGMIGLAFAANPVCNFADAQRCDHEQFRQFFNAMLDQGVWLPPSGYEAMFISTAHDDRVITAILNAAIKSFRDFGR